MLFSVLFGIVITSVGKDRAGLYTYREFILFILHAILSVFFFYLSSWYHELAAIVIVTLPGLFFYRFVAYFTPFLIDWHACLRFHYEM